NVARRVTVPTPNSQRATSEASLREPRAYRPTPNISLLPYHRQGQVRRILRRPVDHVRRLLEIRRGRHENVWNESLRIPVNDRKPGALHLHHDPMAAQEGVLLGVHV